MAESIPFTDHLPLSRNGTWRTYSPVDGLAGLRVEHIVEDHAGHLWFTTTTSGVSRFDGDQFTSFTSQDGLSSNQVFIAEVDRQGRIWFGCAGGVCWYDGGGFHRLAPESWGTDCNILSITMDRDGRIWFAGFSTQVTDAEQGKYPFYLGYYDGGTLQDLSSVYYRDCHNKGAYCWGIAQDNAGDMWFALGHLVRYDGQGFQAYIMTDQQLHPLEIAPQEPANLLNAIAQPPDGGPLWVGGGQSLGRFDGRDLQPVHADIEGFIRKIQTDRLGRIWVCNGGGVLCYDGDQCHKFGVQDGLAHSSIAGVLVDREGLIWFATWGGGVSCYDPLGLEKIGPTQGWPPAATSALALDNAGQMWAAFGNLTGSDAKEVACWDGVALRIAGPQDGLDTTDCMAMHQHSSGDLWLGDWEGLVRYNGQVFQRLGPEQGFEGKRVYALAEDGTGRLYIGHNMDRHNSRNLVLSVYCGQHFTTLVDIERQQHQYISAILPSRTGDVWFGIGALGGQGSGKGIGRYNPTTGLTFYGVAEGLPDSRVEDLCESRDGNLWIATVAGLCCYDGSSFYHFTTEHGLPNNYIKCIHEDEDGWLWLGTESGLTCYDGTMFQTIHSEHISAVTKILADPKGLFWLAGQNSLVGYRPQSIPPRINIQQVVADQIYRDTDRVELFTSTGQIIFEYKGLSFRTRSGHMLYSYRLQGYENDWQAPTRQLSAYYHNLPEGTYCFEVKAFDRDLNESATAQVDVQVFLDPRTAELAAMSSAGVDGDFVGQSAALRRIQAELAQVAPTQETVLILGETGTGKGVAARALHRLSHRKTNPFIQVNCGAIPRDLVESELFGHEKGAFTGATSRKLGKVELAEGGTLFLDEIGDMPLEAQVKLLHLLEEHIFERVGGTESFESHLRVVAATNRDLKQMVHLGTFRQDLYFRLRVFEVQLPTLRQRREDIPLLAAYFAARMAAHLNKPIRELSIRAEQVLATYPWPGNVRELEHAIKRAVIVCPAEEIRPEDLALEVQVQEVGSVADEWVDLEEYDRRYILRVLEHTDGAIRGKDGAAAILGMNPSTLYSRMKKLGIEYKR